MKRLPIFVVLFLIFYGCSQNTEEVPVIEEPEIVLNEYHLQVDTLSEYKAKVGKSSTFSDILHPFKVTYNEIFNIVDTTKDIYDFRKVRAGNEYAAYISADSLAELKYFIYEIDPVEFVVLDFTDSLLNIYRDKKEISVVEKTTSGTIDISLWESLTSMGASPVLALDLSEVFAWQIDFFAIQPGDSYKVLYEEKYIGDELVGLGDIKAAEFTHRGEEHYALLYKQGMDDYFDLDGNSLRKAFLKAPLKFSRISSGYSNSRLHPILKYHRPHHGIDYAAPRGTPVSAVGDGVVQVRAYKGGAGNYVKIKHNGTYTSAYMHLWKYAKGLKVGSKVRQGDVIGYVGSTGLSTGPHLDFRFYVNGQPVNYLNVKFPPSTPVKKENFNKFASVRDSLKNILDTVGVVVAVEELIAGVEESTPANN
ncbi:MAG: peptidase M24 [Melioribacteraceae bacterium]|nr:MAG: peptidase M24 [Melioribacteraceae bacterium]